MTTYVITQTEYLTLNGVPLSTPAWELLNLYVLWGGPGTRGQDVVIPHAGGVRSYPRRAAATRVTLELDITGHTDWAGLAYASPRAGLWANVAHLRTNATDPRTGGDGTVTASLTKPDGSQVSGPVTVEALVVDGSQTGPNHLKATIDVTLAAGALGL